MYNDVKISHIFYPIINSYDDVTKNIVDAKITHIIKSESTNSGVDYIKIIITSIKNSVANVDLYIPGHTVTVLAVPVIDIRDNKLPPTTESYILINGDIGTLSNVYYMLHPDCLTIMEEAPKLVIGLRYNPTSVDHATLETFRFGKTINISSGYNANVNASSGSITIDAGAALGLGGFSSDPTGNDISGDGTIVAKGLLSINGIDGDVTIKSNSNYVNVDCSYMDEHELALQSNDFIKASIGIKINITATDNGEVLI